MAKGKGSIQGWITKNGVHIPIYGHYSIRGGEEPKAKGAKFKRKKKPEHEVIDRTTPQGDYDTKSGDERKQRLIDYIARKEGLDEAAATERYENMRLSERDVMGYEAFKEESRAARANSNIVNHKDYTKNAEQQKKYDDKELERQFDSLPKEKQRQLEKDSWKKDQEFEKQADQEFRNKEAIKEKEAAEEQASSTPKKKSYTADELDGRPASLVGKKGVTNTQMLERELERHPNDEHTAEIKQRLEKSKARDAEQESSKPLATRRDLRDETKTLGDGGKVTPRIKAQEQAYVDNAFKPQVSEKERKMQELRDAERAYVNEAFKDSTKQESSRPDFSKMSYSEAGKESKRFAGEATTESELRSKWGLSKSEAWEILDQNGGIVEEADRALESGVWGDRTPKKTTSTKTSITPKTENTMAKAVMTPRMRGESLADFASRNAENARLLNEIQAKKAEDATKATATKKAFAAKKETTTDKPNMTYSNLGEISVSALTQALKGARPGDKTKIKAELRKRGYTYVGGKWVKGNKS